MKGIFSGLEKLGLGKLEKVEVFEDASKKENDTQEAKKKAPQPQKQIFFLRRHMSVRYAIRSFTLRRFAPAR